MARRLPPLNSVRAFEAAARHRSFKKAADELCVTPAAVSQQVKLLEGSLDKQLFIRHGRRELELTDAGALLLPGLTDLFDGLQETFGRLQYLEHDQCVRLLVPPSLAVHWLAPRLDRFLDRFPDFDLRVRSNFDGRRDQLDDIDLAVYYSPGAFPGMHVELLMDEHVFPVCSPRLREDAHPVQTPEDLRHHTLIHDESLLHVLPEFPTWQSWLTAAGVRGIDTNHGPRMHFPSAAIQATVDGKGVTLGREALVADQLTKGALIKPFDFVYPETFSYSVVCHPDALERPDVAAVREWLLSEASATPVAGAEAQNQVATN